MATRQTKVSELDGKAWLFLGLSGLATGLSWLCYFRALSLGPVSGVAPIDKLSFVLAMLLGVAFLHEKLTWNLGAGAALIVAGVMLTLR
jgi:transporter family protein